MLWEVSFPCQVVDDSWVREVGRLHEAAAYRCKRVAMTSGEFQGDFEWAEAVARELRESEAERDWYEALLVSLQPPEPLAVKSLKPDVPLGSPEPEAPEIFLQTRTVSLEEARQELPSWLEAAKEELYALEVATEAVERVPMATVDKWIEQGMHVVQIPGKAVLTRKSGIGRRRFRAVCCGSHLPPKALNLSKEDLYAGGIDALTVRVVLAYAAQFESWTGCSLDIKTAFLHASVREGKGDGPLIVVKPPYMLIQLGLLQTRDRWVVRKALYGLQSSPADWASYRDKELLRVQISDPICARLFQSLTDSSMWLLRDTEGLLRGVMIVYVDDLAIFSERRIAEALVAVIKGLWKTSEPDWADDNPHMPFCGMEVSRTTQGWRVTQVKYLKELLSRYGIKETASSPMQRWEEPELESASPELIKEAQGVTGALLWSVTRSRPDLMFTTSKMSQWCTKAPTKVKEWGWQALRYAAATLELGLEFNRDVGPRFGSEEQLAFPREPRYLEIYSDASHAPQGDKSIQCILTVWRGSLLLWETARQPFTTLSSAEAELVAMVRAVQVGDCVAPIVEELIQDNLTTSLLGDNSAALAAFSSSSGSWRNRHLRIRAAAARERVEAGVLNVGYVPGNLQVADVGTKPLASAKLLNLLAIVNVKMPMGGSVTGLMTAKFFGRLCGLNLEEARNVSPAVLMLLTVLSQLPVAQAHLFEKGSPWVVILFSRVKGGFGQPGDWQDEIMGISSVAVVGLLLLVGVVCWFWCRVVLGWIAGVEPFVDSRGGQDRTYSRMPQEVSPRHRQERASGSSGPVLGPATGGSYESRSQRGRSWEREDTEAGECIFPMVGRINPNSNWVPGHFVRWLLSLVGGTIFEYLGVRSVEVWRMRALGRTFRYGVASAYEKALGISLTQDPAGRVRAYDIGQAYLAGPHFPEDDPAVDEVRHVPPNEDIGPMPQDLQVFLNHDPQEGNEESLRESSTSTPWSSEPDSEPLSYNGTNYEPQQEIALNRREEEGTSYRAVDGGLVVVHGNRELVVPLQGWSLEVVWSIVRSIQDGDWRHFHEAMAMGNAPEGVVTRPIDPQNEGLGHGQVAIGGLSIPEGMTREGSERTPPARDVLREDLQGIPQLGSFYGWEVGDSVPLAVQFLSSLGWGGWMFVSGLAVLGLDVFLGAILGSSAFGYNAEASGSCSVVGFSSCKGFAETPWFPQGIFPKGLLVLWTLSVLHRLGVVCLGVRKFPWRVEVWLPSETGLVVLRWPFDVVRGIWLLMVVLFGLCSPVEAEEMVAEDGQSEGRQLALGGLQEVCARPQPGRPVEEETSYVLAVVKLAAVISVWEILKKVACRRKNLETAASQTDDSTVVPLLLKDGVPQRAQILYCLWKAGYTVDVEEYPQHIQEDFHRYVGCYWRRRSVDEWSSDEDEGSS